MEALLILVDELPESLNRNNIMDIIWIKNFLGNCDCPVFLLGAIGKTHLIQES